MKYHSLLFFLCVAFANYAFAQEEGCLKGTFDIEQFPQVSFEWHSYSFEPINKKDFKYVKEGLDEVEFDVTDITKDKSKVRKSVVILWEDMKETSNKKADTRLGQYDFSKSVLKGFFESIDATNKDQVYLASFNRRKNSLKCLNPITNGFSSTKHEIISAIDGYEHNTESFKEFSARTDLYSSIREAIELFDNETFDNDIKSIIIFTAGRAMDNSGTDSESQVLLLAQHRHIPIFVLEYYPRSGVATELASFTNGTNGSFNLYDQTQVEDAINELKNIWTVMPSRYSGKDYQIEYTSRLKRGDDQQSVKLKVKGTEYESQLMPPPFSFKLWLKENLLLVILIGVFVIALIILALVLNISAHNRKKRRIAKLEQEQIEAEKRASKAANNAQQLLQEQERRQREQMEAEETARLTNLMRSKNLYPRLQCSAGDIHFVKDITKPVTSIGKASDNDIVLDNPTVSRYHAKITFNGSTFSIEDLNSTNHVIVNGKFIDKCSIKNGDKFSLGEAIISFFV